MKIRKIFTGLLWLLLSAAALAQQPDTLTSRRRGDAKAAVDTIIPLTSDSIKQIAQINPADSLVADSVKARRGNFVTRFFTKNYPNPRTAFLMSLVLPGAGQAYNRKWWKIPIVYAALGGFTYLEINNLTFYRGLRDSYKAKVDDLPETNPLPEYAAADAATLRRFRDLARRQLELSSILLGVAYLLSATNAYVDAHLSRFDVGDDLTLRLRLQETGAAPAFGLGLTYHINGRATPSRPPFTFSAK